MAYWRMDYPRQMHGLGDDNSILLGLGFNSLQIQQITSAHASGALSDGGYQALVSGYIPPDQLADFMAADPGATGQQLPTTVPGPTSPGVALTPGPAPRIPYTMSIGSWFSSSTLIAGLPNWGVLAGAVVILPALAGLIGGGSRRR